MPTLYYLFFTNDIRYLPKELPIPDRSLKDWVSVVENSSSNVIKNILSNEFMEEFDAEQRLEQHGLIFEEKDINPSDDTILNGQSYASAIKQAALNVLHEAEESKIDPVISAYSNLTSRSS
jgi:hypothetical protein